MLAREWMQVFPGRFYLEVQRTNRPNDEEHLHAAVALGDHEHDDADGQSPEIHIFIQAKGRRAAPGFTARRNRGGQKQGADKAHGGNAAAEQKYERKRRPLQKYNTQKRPGRHAENRAQAEIADARPALVRRHNVGDEGSRDRADAAHADAAEKTDGYEKRQGACDKIQGHGGDEFHQTEEQHLLRSHQPDKPPGKKAAHQPSEDHDPGNQSPDARRCLESLHGVRRADHEQHVIGHHHKKIDARHGYEISIEHDRIPRA